MGFEHEPNQADRIGARRASRAVLALLTATIGIGPAAAADPAHAEFRDWSGWHLGIEGSAGASFGSYDFSRTAIGGRRVPGFGTGDATGSRNLGRHATTFGGGVFGGHSWQRGPYLVGLEADLVGANLTRPALGRARIRL